MPQRQNAGGSGRGVAVAVWARFSGGATALMLLWPRGCLLRVRLLLLGAILCAGFLPARAQQDTPTPPLGGIAWVALRVHDLAASIAFYEKLGFEQSFAVEETEAAPNAAAAAAGTVPASPSVPALPSPGPAVAVLKIAVMKINDRQFLELHPATAREPAARFLSLGFAGADLEALSEDYQSRGLTHTAIHPDAAGNLLFTVAGPVQPFGAQQIDFVEYQPGSLHTNDLGRHLGPDRVAESLIAVALAMDDPDAARDFYINELNFKPIAGEPMDLHLPGTSGQEIDLVPADLGSHAQFTLNAANLGRAARRLHKQGLAVEKSGASLSVTDPDGNLILLETR